MKIHQANGETGNLGENGMESETKNRNACLLRWLVLILETFLEASDPGLHLFHYRNENIAQSGFHFRFQRIFFGLYREAIVFRQI